MATSRYFARWLFGSAFAGLVAAFFYAVFPGSVYYGRTFMPDCAMVFFLTAALYAAARYLVEDRALSLRGAGRNDGAADARLSRQAGRGARRRTAAWRCSASARVPDVRCARFAIAVLIAVPFLILALYDRRVASYAEWHWASGITRLHVLPALRDAV